MANYPGSLEHGTAVKKFIDGLVSKGRMVRVSEEDRAWLECPPLGVVFKAGDLLKLKPRVTADLSAVGLNSATPRWPFQYVQLSELSRLASPGWWMGKIDLKGYFTQLPIHPSSQGYLGIRWEGVSYVYTSVPFGLALAPAFASWVSAELAAMMRKRGVAVVLVYLDDFLFAASTKELCQEYMEVALALLKELGVEVAPEKIEGPSQQLEFLGIHFDTIDCSIRISAEKGVRLAAKADSMIQQRRASHADLAILAGKLNWYSQLRPRLRWWARFLYRLFSHSGGHWEPARKVVLSAHLIQILASVGVAMREQYSAPILRWRSFSGHPVIIRCDASGVDGAGGHWGEEAFACPGAPWWGASDNMVAKELYPFALAIERWGGRLNNRVVLLVTDNEGAVIAWNTGSSSNAETQTQLGRLHEAVEFAGCFAVALQLPRSHNVLADILTHVNRWWSGRAVFSRGRGVLTA
jgi:hypothetical protein